MTEQEKILREGLERVKYGRYAVNRTSCDIACDTLARADAVGEVDGSTDLREAVQAILEAHGPGTIIPDWAYDYLVDWNNEASARESERISQELGSGSYVPGISGPIFDDRVIDLYIVNAMKSGDIEGAEKLVYRYRNQWITKLRNRFTRDDAVGASQVVSREAIGEAYEKAWQAKYASIPDSDVDPHGYIRDDVSENAGLDAIYALQLPTPVASSQVVSREAIQEAIYSTPYRECEPGVLGRSTESIVESIHALQLPAPDVSSEAVFRRKVRSNPKLSEWMKKHCIDTVEKCITHNDMEDLCDILVSMIPQSLVPQPTYTEDQIRSAFDDANDKAIETWKPVWPEDVEPDAKARYASEWQRVGQFVGTLRHHFLATLTKREKP